MKINKVILIAFMISGMTALIYEVVWSRPLQLIFGSTIYAVSTILTTFLVGFSLGAYLFRNIADKTKNPLKLFGLIELGIGIYGLIILGLFKIITPIYLTLNVLSLQFLLLFLILIIPATLFGATWPVVNKIYVRFERTGRDIGRLYSFNSFGSFLGPLLAGFILIPLLGIRATSIFATCLNLLIAIVIFSYLIKKGGENED